MNFQAQHQSLAQYDAYHGKSAETRHLKPGELSTGTTIMAVAFEGGVVLCAGAVLTSILCVCVTDCLTKLQYILRLRCGQFRLPNILLNSRMWWISLAMQIGSLR